MRQTTTVEMRENPRREVARLRRLGEVWVHFDQRWLPISAGLEKVLGRVFGHCTNGEGDDCILVETQRSEHRGRGLVCIRFVDIERIEFDSENVRPARTPSEIRKRYTMRKEAQRN